MEGATADTSELVSPPPEVVPPYTTARTPTVARNTADSRLGSHFRLYSLTVIKYAKNAFVFHMAFDASGLGTTEVVDSKILTSDVSHAVNGDGQFD
jgi:hypothetical protein